jgi:hypothetical protein
MVRYFSRLRLFDMGEATPLKSGGGILGGVKLIEWVQGCVM